MTATTPVTGRCGALLEVRDDLTRHDRRWGPQDRLDVDRIVAGLRDSQATRYAAQFYGIPTAAAAKAEADAAARAGECSWTHIAIEELAEAVEAAALCRSTDLRIHLVRFSSAGVRWVEALDRRREQAR